MLLGHWRYLATFEKLLAQPIWEKALDWIIKMPADLADGEHEIEGTTMFANVHTVATRPRGEGAYEAHQHYIDLHYCLTGGEVIEWAPIEALTPKTEYNQEKDYTLYEVPAQATSLLLTPGAFAIFLPGEGHMPKISDGKHVTVHKVVIKIHRDLLL